jgi:NAD(P)-dependent dehydrogenase (short-subunit alcohol dehydrogenase family)
VKVTAARVDVADRAAVFAWAEQVASDHGRVNLVFNNAGVALGARVARMELADFEWLMGINFWGVVHGTQAFLPHLMRSGEGHVVNVSSVFGLIGFPGQAAYNAAKFGVRGFTEALRMELEIERLPVSASCVHPGGIRTAIARKARIGADEEWDGDREQMEAEFERVARTTPEAAARVILAGVRRDARRILVGPDARVISGLQRLFPSLYQRGVVWSGRRRRKLI